MSTEQTPTDRLWKGRSIVKASECDEWRKRVDDGESAAQVARDVDEWGYATIHDHISGRMCRMHGENDVPPATPDRGGRGLPVPSDEDVEAVHEGLRDALDANFGDTAHIRIKTFRKNRAVDVRGQVVGVIMRELAESGDPKDEFDVESCNPESGRGQWFVRYAEGER